MAHLTLFVNEIDRKINALQDQLSKPYMEKPGQPNENNTVVLEAPSNGLKFEKRKVKTTITKHIINKSEILRTVGPSVIHESSESECESENDEKDFIEDPPSLSHELIVRENGDSSFGAIRTQSVQGGISPVSGQDAYVNLLSQVHAPSGSLTKMQVKRRAILLQLHEAEESYVQALKSLVMRYYVPLKNKNIITDHNINIIFYKVPEIHMHHQLLQHQYDKLLTYWRDSCTVGDVFIQAFSKDSMKESYLDFISNFLSCQQTLRVCRSSAPFSRFLEQQSKQDEKRYTIDDLLIQPVQRIPRYELFFRDLIRCTPDDHPDYPLIQEALQCIHVLAVEIDEAKDAVTSGAREDLCQLGSTECQDDDASSLSSIESDDYTMQAKVIFQDGHDKRKDGRIFLYSNQIALMYRKRRTVFLSRQQSVDYDHMAIMKATFRKQYVPRFEANIADIEALDISEKEEEEMTKTLRMTKDYMTLKTISSLAVQLSCPIPQLDSAISEALREKQPNQLLDDEGIETINWKIRELLVRYKNKHELSVVVWFGSPEERVHWRNAINNHYSGKEDM